MSTLTITQENFEQEVLQSNVPILVDFWAPWCGPCRMIAPVLDEISQETSGTAKVGKVNVDEQPELAARFNVSSIPTLLVFKDGELVSTSVGAKSKQALLDMLNQ